MAEARRPVPLSRRPVDLFLAIFLLSNVPVVVLFESQMLLPPSLVFKPLRDMTQAYVEFAGDYLVQTAPAFLKGLVVAECLFQLPLSIVNAYAFMAGKDWGRITGILYASHVATTMFPILADILAHNIPTKSLLLSIYLPYLIIPFIILARLVPTQHPFTEAGTPSIAKKELGMDVLHNVVVLQLANNFWLTEFIAKDSFLRNEFATSPGRALPVCRSGGLWFRV